MDCYAEGFEDRAHGEGDIGWESGVEYALTLTSDVESQLKNGRLKAGNGSGILEQDSLVAIHSRMIDLRLQSPLEMRKRLRRTPEPQRFANIIPSGRAELALETWEPNFESDPVADLERGDGAANCSYDARGFMA